MKRFLPVIFFLSIPLFAQSSVALRWEKLAECMPKIEKVADLKRGELTGGNEPNAYVSLLYYNSAEIMERSKEIQILLDDFITQEEFIEDNLGNAPEFSKPILVNGKYKGVKIISVYDSVVEYCTYHIVVAGRFLISLRSTTEGDFTKEIEILIDNFDFNMMAKLK